LVKIDLKTVNYKKLISHGFVFRSVRVFPGHTPQAGLGGHAKSWVKSRVRYLNQVSFDNDYYEANAVRRVKMEILDSFKNRQDELLGMIRDLRVMLKPEQLKVRPNAKTAHDQLCSLGEKLKRHLSEEDRGVYPPLLTQDNPKLKSLAWGFISGEKPLRKQFEAYYQKWLKECDFNFTDLFLEETLELFAAIESRIDREQSVLLPKLEESGVFSGAMS
jgi:hemerythrin-like domain-containing protein